MITQPSTLDVGLEKLTYGGDAMGRLEDGRAVFVPFGLPGERVRVHLTQEKRNYARGELVEILQASQDRILARCKHFVGRQLTQYTHPFGKRITIKSNNPTVRKYGAR